MPQANFPTFRSFFYKLMCKHDVYIRLHQRPSCTRGSLFHCSQFRLLLCYMIVWKMYHFDRYILRSDKRQFASNVSLNLQFILQMASWLEIVRKCFWDHLPAELCRFSQARKSVFSWCYVKHTVFREHAFWSEAVSCTRHSVRNLVFWNSWSPAAGKFEYKIVFKFTFSKNPKVCCFPVLLPHADHSKLKFAEKDQ